MADRRYIAQSITDSGQVAQLIASCGAWAGILFSWAIAFVDDDSRLVGEPDLVRHKILGRYLDLVSEEDVAEYLATMNDLELAVWYQVANAPLERYLYFPKFTLHQTLRADRYGPSRFPPPPRWKPEEGHPYTKTPELAKTKPQRDRRETVRVAKRPVNKGAQLSLATAARPSGASLATAAQPPADRLAPSGDEASRHVTSPLLTSPLLTAERDRLSEGTAAAAAGANGASPTERAAEIVEGATGLWRTVLELLRDRAAEDSHLSQFVTWYAGTALERRGQTYYVVAPNAFAGQYLGARFISDIRAAVGVLSDEIGPDVRVVLRGEVPGEGDKLNPASASSQATVSKSDTEASA